MIQCAKIIIIIIIGDAYIFYIVSIKASYSGILSVIEFICLSLAYLYENTLRDRTEM